jgi:drug/metabolite transporter (DMT)-like permease
LESAGATNTSMVTFLVPVSAIVLGILFLGETLHTSHILGMALIGLGLIVIDGRIFSRCPD